MPGVLLFDGNCRRQALDVLEFRLLHLADELPGIGAEALHVAPLPLGVDGVHRQRGLSRTARTAADGHPVAGNLHIQVLQVVLPRPAELDRRGRLNIRRRGGRGTRRSAADPEHRPQRLAGVGALGSSDLFRRAGGDQPAPSLASLGPQVDDPVGGLDDLHVVLDNQHGVAGVDKAV